MQYEATYLGRINMHSGCTADLRPDPRFGICSKFSSDQKNVRLCPNHGKRFLYNFQMDFKLNVFKFYVIPIVWLLKLCCSNLYTLYKKIQVKIRTTLYKCTNRVIRPLDPSVIESSLQFTFNWQWLLIKRKKNIQYAHFLRKQNFYCVKILM